jgi:hypothetical protein
MMLALIVGIAAPASGQGMWTYLHIKDTYNNADNITLSIVNLTSHRLVVASPEVGTSFSVYCQQYATAHICNGEESYPFQAASVPLYIDPYRTAIWASHMAKLAHGDYAWDGRIDVYPEGTVSTFPGERFTVYVNAVSQTPDPGNHPVIDRNTGKGTWWYLNAKYSSTELWYPGADMYFNGIYATPINVKAMYSAMTMTGYGLTASLFAAADSHPVLVVRENSGSAASETLDQSQTATWIYRPSFGQGVYINGYNSSRMAQTVTAGQSGLLDRVSVYVDSSITTNGPVTVSIQTVSNGLPSGIEIGNGTIPAAALPTYGNPQWVSANINSSLEITAGTQYAIVLSAGGNQITWYGSGDVYSGGYMVFDYASGWGSVGNADAMFQTYIIPDVFDRYLGWQLDYVDQGNASVPSL